MTEPSRFKKQAAVGFISVIALSASALVAVLVVERQASSNSRRIMTEYRREVGAAHRLELGAERLVAHAVPSSRARPCKVAKVDPDRTGTRGRPSRPMC